MFDFTRYADSSTGLKLQKLTSIQKSPPRFISLLEELYTDEVILYSFFCLAAELLTLEIMNGIWGDQKESLDGRDPVPFF